MKVAFSALIPKLALLLGLGALALGGCGGASSCSEDCRKATTCSSLPGVLGSEQTACVA